MNMVCGSDFNSRQERAIEGLMKSAWANSDEKEKVKERRKRK